MISRQWRGLARLDQAGAYEQHLRDETFPALRSIDGFRDAAILRRGDGRLMRSVLRAFAIVVLATPAAQVCAARITDEAAAVSAAKAYTKGRCTAESPCTYRARREAKQWNVWVQLTKRSRPGAAPSPAGHLILYFDAEGNLVRRIEGD